MVEHSDSLAVSGCMRFMAVGLNHTPLAGCGAHVEGCFGRKSCLINDNFPAFN